MKKITTPLLLLSSFLSFGQLSTGYNIMNVNNVAARVTNFGEFFGPLIYDEDLGNYVYDPGGYEVPQGSGVTTSLLTSFYYIGKDQDGTIKSCFQESNPGVYDFFRGPFSSTNSYYDSAYQVDWSVSQWEICQSEIDQFVAWYDCNLGLDPNIPGLDCSNITPPSNASLNRIASWPGNGDTTLGQAFHLAPFFDRNQDGIYDPIASGDYPLIKGCCATYLIQRDMPTVHTYTDTDPIGIEMHYMVYQFNTWDYLNDATFVDVMVINRGTTNYTDFSHGAYTDVDLGNAMDDYIGCDSTLNLTYYYNADNTDEDNGSITGYGVNPPAIGIVSLNNPLSFSGPYQSASTDSERFNTMMGKQPDGQERTKPDGSPTHFIYSGNPSNSTDWSESTPTSTNSPGDRRALMGSYDGIFNSGDTILESYAFIYARGGNNLQSVQDLLAIASDVKDFSDSLIYVPCGYQNTWNVNETPPSSGDIQIVPNPTNGEFIVSNDEQKEMLIQIYDISGKVIYTHPESLTSVSINLNGKPKGVYFVKASTSDSEIVRKVILQ